MAIQAVGLGRHEAGRDLADATAEVPSLGAPARTRAWVTGMRAEAISAGGNRHCAHFLLREAESLERGDSQSGDDRLGYRAKATNIRAAST
jgi:hypothetical protein